MTRPIDCAFPPVPRFKDTKILWEGPCAYVLHQGECYEVIVFSTNCVTHKPAGMTDCAEMAERICRGLNAHPRQTREAYGL
ncbi:hypothetical protein [Bradyrhizobium sp. SRS-191]|uniref:hypothetical protein n=1 Tax=Bradyrhizobium sp. SRS-191 TaxID=2962606 RepID=UPI00211F0072|nr:hypothetical protein [Bradyrhizobium sp. SRS-191]